MGARLLSVTRGTRNGAIGWAALALFVYAWDLLAPETLSSAYWRGLDHKITRPFVLFGTGWTLSHLIARKPRRILIRW